VDEKFIRDVLPLVILLDDPVDVTDGGAHKESKYERNNVVSSGKDVGVDALENQQQREAPADAINNCPFAGGEELVDDVSQEEEMNQGPDEERIGRWGDVGLFAVVIWGSGARNAVYV